MSTNPNLPADFAITSINGIRCTAVPRSLTTLDPNVTVVPFSGGALSTTTTPAATQTTSSSTEGTTSASTTENTQAQQTSTSGANAKAQVAPPSNTEGTQSSTTAIAVASAVTNAPPTAVAAAPQASAPTNLSGESSTTEEALSSTTTSSARPASKGTTPTVNSETAIPQAQSVEHGSPTALTNSQSGFYSTTASATATELAPAKVPNTQNSSRPPGISASPRMSAAPVIGGVVGLVALMSIVTILFWLLRRRKREDRDGVTSPREYGERHKFYEIDNGSVGPTRRTVKWKEAMGYRVERIQEGAADLKSAAAGLGASLKSKMTRGEASMPSVNLNRGNSQFMDGPVSQHSRNNSSLSQSPEHPTAKDRLAEFLQSMSEKMGLNKIRRNRHVEGMDSYTRGMTEKSLNNPPSFSQLLAVDERRHSRNLSMSSIPNLGSLGLDFTSHDPFADPLSKPSSTNPFADPISPPKASVPKQSTLINEMRRSRGQSIDMARNNFNKGPSSRYPSTIATRDSYRETAFSTNIRKGKGRSDPFDLERPELLRQIQQGAPPQPKLTMPPGPPPHVQPASRAIGGTRVQSVVHTPRITSGAPTYGSKYSSGASSFSGWGDPGPDLGAGSGAGSLRAEVVSMGSEEFDWTMADGKDEEEGADVSPISTYSKSSFGGVGKAM